MLRPCITLYFVLTISLTAPIVDGQSTTLRSPATGQQLLHSVTVEELSHVVPKTARAEMDKAEKAARKRNLDGQIEHLRKAIEIDAQYVSARNSLALSLFTRDPTSAVSELEQAIDIDPHQPLLFNNLAIAYLLLKKVDEAERAARAAMSLGAGDPRTRILLGWILIDEKKFTTEALNLVKSGGEQLPAAYLLAARVLIAQGNLKQAKSYIQAYLSSGDEDYRDLAEQWLEAIIAAARGRGGARG